MGGSYQMLPTNRVGFFIYIFCVCVLGFCFGLVFWGTFFFCLFGLFFFFRETFKVFNVPRKKE